MANFLRNAFIESENNYGLLKPFGVIRSRKESKKNAQQAFDTLLQLVSSNDIVYKKLSELHFTVDSDNRCLLAMIPRSKVSTELYVDAIEIDANVWITEELNSIQRYFIQFELAGIIEVVPMYIEDRDIIVFKMQSIYETDIEESGKFKNCSIFITIMWITILVLSLTNILTLILQ